jgi:hypothetical protein
MGVTGPNTARNPEPQSKVASVTSPKMLHEKRRVPQATASNAMREVRE